MSTLYLFDGIGLDNERLLTKLRALCFRPQNSAYFDVLCRALEQTLDYVGPDVCRQVLPEGLPLRSWLRGGTPAAPIGRANSILGGIFGIAYQLCHLQPAAPAVLTVEKPVGALGHSLGLHSAVVAGLHLRRTDEYFAQCAASLKLVALCLIRAHQVAGEQSDQASTVRFTDWRDGQRPPSAMASVSGVSTSDLLLLMNCPEQEAPGGHASSGVSLSLINSNRFHVLSGRPAALMALYSRIEQQLRAAGGVWSFLPSTAPFHSSILEPAFIQVRQDRNFIGFESRSDQLRFPVFGTNGRSNLQDSHDLLDEIARMSMVQLLDWPTAVDFAVSTASPTQVMDVGPGPGARAFTRHCLRGHPRHLRYRSAEHLQRSV
ncbi:hypothetical protein [Microbispora sp. NPDC046933]|uniref:hypothetical protein n=1 Tax=Microbispora sp. NPDC046933 TaxID=3155618 RepID=UPI0033EA7908